MEKINQFELFEKHQNDPLRILYELGGFYECPKDKEGKRLGPLVGYAGKYTGEDGSARQYVGDIYANFSVLEQYPILLYRLANIMTIKNDPIFSKTDLICGPQMGGIAIAQMLAYITGSRFAYIEKKVTQLATDNMREQATLNFIRHSIFPGEKVIIVEDVLNNFSTTKETIEMIEARGGEVVAIGGLLNRSVTIDNEYDFNKRNIPVFSLVKKPFAEYKQDDPFVASDIQTGNIVLKPKNEWSKLAYAMIQNK